MATTEQRWKVILHRRAERVLRRLPRDLLQRVDREIEGLATNPKPPGCRKLAGYDNLYRVRVGDWRISYAVEDDRLIVLVLEVSPRSGAYRFRRTLVVQSPQSKRAPDLRGKGSFFAGGRNRA